jgi:hypothetical protein
MDTNRPSGSRTKLVRSPSEAMLVTPSAVLAVLGDVEAFAAAGGALEDDAVAEDAQPHVLAVGEGPAVVGGRGVVEAGHRQVQPRSGHGQVPVAHDEVAALGVDRQFHAVADLVAFQRVPGLDTAVDAVYTGADSGFGVFRTVLGFGCALGPRRHPGFVGGFSSHGFGVGLARLPGIGDRDGAVGG